MQTTGEKPIAVAQREDMADKQRMVGALVPRRHLGSDRRDRVREEGYVAGILVFRIDSVDRPAGEVTDQGFLPTGENVHAEMSGLQQERVHSRFLAHGHDAQWRCVVMTVTPVTNDAMTRAAADNAVTETLFRRGWSEMIDLFGFVLPK
jgi:hypothetical protein